MSEDCYEGRARYWVNVPQRTHKVMLDGQCIGLVWSDGQIEIFDDPSAAHQVPRSSSDEAPP